MSEALAKVEHHHHFVQLSAGDMDTLCKMLPVLEKASPTERTFFVAYCQRIGLDPFLRLIHPIVVQGRMAIQIGIDGWLALAERTGQYAGIDGPYFCDEQGNWNDFWPNKTPPFACKVGVFRKGFRQATYATILYSEFAVPSNPNWKARPTRMMEVRATCHAIRKAFPDLNQTMSLRDHTGRAVELVYGDIDDDPAPELVPDGPGQAWIPTRSDDVEDAEFEVPPPSPVPRPPDAGQEVTWRQVVAAAKTFHGLAYSAEQLVNDLVALTDEALRMDAPVPCGCNEHGEPSLLNSSPEQLAGLVAYYEQRLQTEAAA